MTDLDLAAIRQRVEKATEGPWYTGFDYEKHDPTVIAPGYIEHTIDYPLDEVGLENGKADAEFIAHAREDIPALLAEIERLNATIQRVRDIVNDKYLDAGQMDVMLHRALEGRAVVELTPSSLQAEIDRLNAIQRAAVASSASAGTGRSIITARMDACAVTRDATVQEEN